MKPDDNWTILCERRGEKRFNEKPLLYYLYSTNDNKYIECQPLYDEESMYYSGGPTEYVEVEKEYVRQRYPNIDNSKNMDGK